MLGLLLSTPWAAFLYTFVLSMIIAALGVLWWKAAYHDEEDERDWDPETAFVMEWEPDMDPEADRNGGGDNG
jgi:hypothetical protein